MVRDISDAHLQSNTPHSVMFVQLSLLDNLDVLVIKQLTGYQINEIISKTDTL